MRIAIVQTHLFWENVSKNIHHFDEKINTIEAVDLIVLPEMFTSGFTMNPQKVAQSMDGEVVCWLKKTAKQMRTAICCSMVIEENKCFFNRFLFVKPNEDIYFYNKRHLFTLANEHLFYTPGKEKVIINYLDWRICFQVCYDLRFPVFVRNKDDYDLLIYVANWPKTRINVWDTLIKARAIENMSYVVGVNRIGEDENNLSYVGHSQVVDALGEYLIEPYKDEAIKIITLNKDQLTNTRKKLPFLNDKDEFQII